MIWYAVGGLAFIIVVFIGSSYNTVLAVKEKAEYVGDEILKNFGRRDELLCRLIDNLDKSESTLASDDQSIDEFMEELDDLQEIEDLQKRVDAEQKISRKLNKCLDHARGSSESEIEQIISDIEDINDEIAEGKKAYYEAVTAYNRQFDLPPIRLMAHFWRLNEMDHLKDSDI